MALSKKPVNGMKDILPEEMQIREHVPIHADGSIPSWKRPDQMNICRYMKMSVELIFLTQKISA